MGGFRCLTIESYNYLHNLHRTKIDGKLIINDAIYQELEDCDSFKQLMLILKKNFSIKEIEEPPIWLYLIHTHWKWFRDEPERSTTFNQWQSEFMKNLLFNGGIYLHDQCLAKTLTYSQIQRQVTPLEKQKIIFSLRTPKTHGSQVIFILHPLFIQEVRNAKV